MGNASALFTTHIDRSRDVLITVGEVVPLRRDLDLHLLSIGVRHDPFTLEALRDAVSAMALYLASRPRFEFFGWTIHFEEPLLNVFAAGSASESSVVGRAFLEGVHSSPPNRFYAQISRPFGDLQTSSVDVRGTDIFDIVRQYCEQSDQQLVRLFRGPEGRATMLSALPCVDASWFVSIEEGEALDLLRSPEVKNVSEKRIAFRCGCDRDRIVSLVVELYRESPEDLFRGDPVVEVECPRCAAKHSVTRQSFDAESA